MNTIVEKRNLAEELQAAFVRRGLHNEPLRANALDQLLAKGLPGPKTEEYKFTPITRQLEKNLKLDIVPNPSTATLAHPLLAKQNFNLVVFTNGRFDRSRSVIRDSELVLKTGQAGPLEASADPFDLLNAAFYDEVVELSVPDGKTVSNPVAIIYAFDNPAYTFANPRWRCKLGAGSAITILEHSVKSGEAAYFNNKQSNILAGANSSLEYVAIQGDDIDLFMGNAVVELGTGAKASCFTYTFGGELVRNNLTLIVDGEAVDAHLYGLYLLSKNTLADNHTVVDHRKPNSFSNELYKGVMDEQAKGVFNGKIYVRPQAQKTNAFQSNRNILLSETATINTKPQLEIWADDVKCSHGCTTGQLDEDALFYLRSRGIPKDMARGMMLYAFAAETLGAMKNEPIRNYVDELISAKLRKNF